MWSWLSEFSDPTPCETCGQQQLKACDGLGHIEIDQLFRACPRKRKEPSPCTDSSGKAT